MAEVPRRIDAAAPEDELARVYREHVRFVWRVAAAFAVPTADREDFVHDVFVVAHRRASDRRPEVAMTTWLFGIAKHVRLNRQRTQARHERKLRALEPPPDADRPDDAAQRAESIALVRAFLDGLDAPQRIAFELIEVRGVPAAEVAAATGDNVNTIYTRLRAARLAFREFVAARMAK